jgi:hypothetical protein
LNNIRALRKALIVTSALWLFIFASYQGIIEPISDGISDEIRLRVEEWKVLIEKKLELV